MNDKVGIKKYEIGERVEFTIKRIESNFDRACDAAYDQALLTFGADDSGCLTRVKDSECHQDYIVVEFVRYVRVINNHEYHFIAWVEREI